MHKCKKCDRVFDSVSQLGGHQSVHREVGKQFKCKKCELVFESVAKLAGHHNSKHIVHERKVRVPKPGICENCGLEHDGTYASGRFCSAKCSYGFSTKNKRKETNEKIKSKYAEKYPSVEIICPECGTVRSVEYSKRNKVKTCSRKCGIARTTRFMNSPEGKEILRQKRIASIHSGNVGYGIKCNYNGIRCDSALEYAFLVWYTEKYPESKIERYKGSLQGEGITYIPDFVIDEKILVEVKYSAPYIGEALSEKWKTYVDTVEKKKKILDSTGLEYLWVTEKDIGEKLYRECVKKVKTMIE